jgi:S-disulfanyl-L-cysteine oxidoreductase SoxD
MVRRMGLLGVFLMLAIVQAMASQQGTTRTVLDGAYTEAQAEMGREAFAANCERCHEGVCPDGPPLVGPLFVERWREDSLASLFRWVSTRMPRNAQGSLSEKTYLDAIAYLLKENGFPAGNTELTAANAAEIQFIGKNGPRPLPGNAVVEVVGCLARNPAEGWDLTKGSKPVRYRFGNDTSPDEVKAAGAKPLGAATYQLANVEQSRTDFNPATMTGQKVLVRGPLLRQRIHVTAMEVLGACTQ